MKRLTSTLLGLSLGLAAIAPAYPQAVPYLPARWERTGQLYIHIVDDVSAVWEPYLVAQISYWNAQSATTHITLVKDAGNGDNVACGYVFGKVHACSAAYGANGWYGYTLYATSGGWWVESNIRYNDSYAQSTARKANTVGHELAHNLGLDHRDTTRTNANTGSILDMSNNPAGDTTPYGPLSDLQPCTADIAGVAYRYSTIDGAQLVETKL